MKGRKAIPISVKKAKGTLKPERVKNVPDPSAEKPKPPSWLNKRAKQIFWQMVARLAEIGVASDTYTEVIALLSARLEEVERFDKMLNEDGSGYVYQTKNSFGDDVLKEHPAVKLREKAARHAHTLLVDLGLTPAAIQKLGKIEKKPAKNEFSDF